jgi:Flp pilus assembly protein TadD
VTARRRHRRKVRREDFSATLLEKSSRRTFGHLWPPILLVLLGALAYATGLDNPFIYDDRVSIVDNRTIEDLGNLGAVFSPPFETPVAGRPLVNLSFAINYAIGGRDVTGYHVVNIALHLACGLLIFGIIRRTLAWPAAAGWTGDAGTAIAVAVSGIWLVHPINSEVVNYLTQRTESMMALCYLATLYAAIRAWDAAGRRLWTGIAVSTCALGMLCKESMVTAPVMVLLYDRAFATESFGAAIRRRFGLYAGLAASWLVLAGVVLSSPRTLSAGFTAYDADVAGYLLNQARVIVSYLELTFWPRDLALYYGWPLPLTVSDVWIQLLTLTALAVVTLLLWLRRPALGYAGLWFLITLAPTSSIVPIATEVGAERRMYLPVVAIIAMTAWGVWILLRRIATGAGTTHTDGRTPPARFARRAGTVLTAVAIGLGGAGTRARTEEYASSLTLARTTLERWPSPAAHSMYGTELAAAGRFTEAEQHLRTAAPDYPPAKFYLGTVLARTGRHAEAIEVLRGFIAGQPPELDQVYRARVALADALSRTGRTTDAIAEYRRMLADRPTDFEALAALANALVREGQYDEAVARYQAYLAGAPDDARAQSGLAVALAAQGRMEEAVIAFRRAADLEPDNPRTLQNLARALASTGRRGEAVPAAERAVTLAPSDPAAHLLLGQILLNLGDTPRARTALERAVALDPNSPARDLLKQIR